MALDHQMALAKMESMDVREKASVFEALTAIVGVEVEMANRYEILNPANGERTFYAVEKTGFCGRQVKQCLPDCAAWDLDVIYMPKEEVVYELRRPWTCTCCCFNRPVVDVTDVISGQKIGSVADPWHCCSFTLTVRGPEDQDLINAKGGCCQWGYCCPLPCGPCSRVEFPLEDATSGESLGHMQKKVPGCCKWLFASDVDDYHLTFGEGMRDPNHKALVMALAIFTDFRWFSDNSADDQGGLAGKVTGYGS